MRFLKMLRSMTGFGRAQGAAGNFDVDVEVKSLNNRYFDIFVRLPKELNSREFDFRELIKKMISRGKVTLTVNLKRKESGGNEVLNETALKETLNLLNAIRKTAGIDDDAKLEHLLMLQDQFMEDLTEIDDETFAEIIEITKTAIRKMVEMRENEGRQLKNDFSERLEFVSAKVAEIERMLDGEVKNYFEKLKERAKNLLAEFSQYDERLKLELALIAEKYDVSEEIVRLKSHIKQFREMLNSGNEVGKKLNFIVQEMNREANTINSKSVSTEISYRALAIKEELEKMREQIQNVE